jgi:hypothetical protein
MVPGHCIEQEMSVSSKRQQLPPAQSSGPSQYACVPAEQAAGGAQYWLTASMQQMKPTPSAHDVSPQLIPPSTPTIARSGGTDERSGAAGVSSQADNSSKKSTRTAAL